MSSVKVAVRVRPFNNRELSHDCTSIIDMSDKMTSKPVFIYNTNNAKIFVLGLNRKISVFPVRLAKTKDRGCFIIHYYVNSA